MSDVTPHAAGMGQIAGDIRDQLASAGLDPDDLILLIERAVAEDLDGGVDVTSVWGSGPYAATSPPCRSSASR